MEKYTIVDNVILDFSGIHPKLMTNPFPVDLSLSLSLSTLHFSLFFRNLQIPILLHK